MDITNADVEIWRLHGNYLLWGGHEQTSGLPTKVGINPAWRSDTVLYLTDLRTLDTQEIFRYSSLEDLEYENKMVKRLEWLPDGQTIAVSLLRKPNAPFVPVPTLPSGGYPVLHSQAGILLIHLEWLDES